MHRMHVLTVAVTLAAASHTIPCHAVRALQLLVHVRVGDVAGPTKRKCARNPSGILKGSGRWRWYGMVW